MSQGKGFRGMEVIYHLYKVLFSPALPAFVGGILHTCSAYVGGIEASMPPKTIPETALE